MPQDKILYFVSFNISQLFQIIKQSQDDGGDVITWKVSPVNERLKSLASKHLPRTTRVFAEASGISGSILQPCSETVSHSRSEKQFTVYWFPFFFFFWFWNLPGVWCAFDNCCLSFCYYNNYWKLFLLYLKSEAVPAVQQSDKENIDN